MFLLVLWVPDLASHPPDQLPREASLLVLGGAGASQVGSLAAAGPEAGTKWLVGTSNGPAPPGSALALPSCREACYKLSLPC